MRLMLAASRWVLLDIEVLAFRRLTEDGDDQLMNTSLEDSERSDSMEPDTTVGFGFRN